MQTISEPTPEELFISAAPLIVDAIVSTCHKQGYCNLGIVGGRSIPGILETLLPYAPQLKGRIEVFWLDERIGPEKNYPPALPHLEKLKNSGVDITWYPLQSLNRQAMEVEAQQIISSLTTTSVVKFDVVLLSAGEDGHIAALFPHKETLHHKDLNYAIVDHAPKPPPLRITVTPKFLLTANHAFLIFVGDKQHAYELFTAPGPIENCPAKLLEGIPHLTILTSMSGKR